MAKDIMGGDLERLHNWRLRPLRNWQRATICGLLLAGVGFTAACRIAKCHVKSAQSVIPQDWHHMNRWGTARQRRPVVWAGERLEEGRRAYADLSQPLKVTAHRIGSRPDILHTLAVLHGWPPRRPARARPARQMMACAVEHRATP